MLRHSGRWRDQSRLEARDGASARRTLVLLITIAAAQRRTGDHDQRWGPSRAVSTPATRNGHDLMSITNVHRFDWLRIRGSVFIHPAVRTPAAIDNTIVTISVASGR